MACETQRAIRAFYPHSAVLPNDDRGISVSRTEYPIPFDIIEGHRCFFAKRPPTARAQVPIV